MEGHELRTLRHQLGMTQKQVSDYLGVSRETVWRWEMGQSPVKDVYADKLIRLLEESF